MKLFTLPNTSTPLARLQSTACAAVMVILVGFVISLVIAENVVANDVITSTAAVTIEGKPVPALHFEVFAEHYLESADEFLCPPVSDALLRDQVINFWLYDLAMRSSADLSDQTRAEVKRVEDKLATLKESYSKQHAALELRVMFTHSRAFRNLNPAPRISSRLIVDHYQRMVEQNHPKITNVDLVKRRELYLHNQSAIDTVTEMLQAGKDIQQIADAIDRPDQSRFLADEWYALDTLDYELDATAVAPGSIVGPIKREFDSVVVYIADKKTVSRIRPSTRINANWKYAISVAESDLYLQSRLGTNDEWLEKLWARYSVQLDGEPLEKATSYPSCPKK